MYLTTTNDVGVNTQLINTQHNIALNFVTQNAPKTMPFKLNPDILILEWECFSLVIMDSSFNTYTHKCIV